MKAERRSNIMSPSPYTHGEITEDERITTLRRRQHTDANIRLPRAMTICTSGAPQAALVFFTVRDVVVVIPEAARAAAAARYCYKCLLFVCRIRRNGMPAPLRRMRESMSQRRLSVSNLRRCCRRHTQRNVTLLQAADTARTRFKEPPLLQRAYATLNIIMACVSTLGENIRCRHECHYSTKRQDTIDMSE